MKIQIIEGRIIEALLYITLLFFYQYIKMFQKTLMSEWLSYKIIHLVELALIYMVVGSNSVHVTKTEDLFPHGLSCEKECITLLSLKRQGPKGRQIQYLIILACLCCHGLE